MKYGFTIPAADLAVANTPEIGGESKRVYASYEEYGLVGSIAMTAPTSGVLTPNVPAFAFETAGNDLAVRAGNGIRSAADVVLVFNVTFDDATTGTARATFAVPSYAQNTSSNLPMGLAVDINGDGAGATKKIKSLDSLASIVGGSRGSQFDIIALPSTWYFLPGTTSKAETLNVPKGLDIAHGLNATEWTKFGMSEAGKIDLEAFHLTAGDGLQRLNAIPFSLLVETWAENRVLKERSVYGGCRGAFNADRKDGDDKVMDKGTANFNRFLKFV